MTYRVNYREVNDIMEEDMITSSINLDPFIKAANLMVTDRYTGLTISAALAKETEDLTLDRARLVQGVETVFRDPTKGRYLVATLDGEVVGQLMLTYEWSDWRNGTFIWIQSVYVDPEHRRRGVFRALYDRVRRLVSEEGFYGIRLYVHDGNRAGQATYKRLGMVAPGYVVFETPDPIRESRESP